MSSPPASSSPVNWVSIGTGELVIITKEEIINHQEFGGAVQNNDSDVIISQNPELYSAYPNPFNGQVVIPFKVPKNNETMISVFNISGHSVYDKYLSSKEKETGKIIWKPNTNKDYLLPSGVYIIKMFSGYNTKTSKIMFIK
tara:strand:- start:207 stop:632 length:426 start_codon:yes stop_codon:yes gene_type:complete